MASSEEGSDQPIERHDLGQDPCFAPEAGPSENLVQFQPLPNLVANVDGSRLPGLFDLNLIPINVAAALVLLWTPSSHLRLLERDLLLRGVIQKAFLAAGECWRLAPATFRATALFLGPEKVNQANRPPDGADHAR